MAQVTFSVNISIAPAPLSAVAPTVNETGTVGQPLTASLAGNVQGGTPPVSFAVSSGTLPDGLTMDNAGNLSGTPTSAGTTTVGVTATDSGA